MQDGAATSGLADDDRGDGDRARGLRDCVAEVHRIAAEVIQDKTAGMEQPGVGGEVRLDKGLGTGGSVAGPQGTLEASGGGQEGTGNHHAAPGCARGQERQGRIAWNSVRKTPRTFF